MNRLPRLRVALGIAGLACVALVFVATFRQKPSFSDATYSIDGGEAVPFSMPLSIVTGENTTVTVEARVRLPAGMTRLRFTPDDCLQELEWNGTPLADASLPFCDYSKGRVIDVSAAARAGDNEVRAVLKNDGGPAALSIQPSSGNARGMAVFALLALGLCTAAVASLRAVRGAKGWSPLDAALAGSILVRVAYVAQTATNVRGYDTDGHIEYIEHVARHWSVPAIADGWQFYQPPLYYLLAAVPAAIAGADRETVVLGAQLVSLCVSVCSLVVAAWIATLFFPKKQQQPSALLAFALYAFFPATVFFSARINNDVLLEFLGLLSWGCLCAWWFGKKANWWYGAVLALSLALLTKSNALLLAPVLAACLAFKPGHRLVTRVRLGAAGLAIVVVLTGWYAALRAIEGQSRIVANLPNLNSALRLETDWENMAEFNPVRVAAQPYNNPWDDAKGRQHFWEYLFRSAFTGEFSFGTSLAPLASATIALGLLVFTLAVAGGWHTLVSRPLELLPLWLAPAVFFAGHAAYRQFVAPYSSSQDFRYSILALLPLALAAVQGMAYVPFVRPRWSRVAAWSFVACCALFACSVGAA